MRPLLLSCVCVCVPVCVCVRVCPLTLSSVPSLLPEIDIELLKRHTVYEGYSPGDKTIKLFWKVMESFTDDERSRYVRFAWGRSRLPSATGLWTSKHKLTRRSGPEKQLPIAHTCFFSVEMPVYTTEEGMRWGLTTAITFGMSTPPVPPCNRAWSAIPHPLCVCVCVCASPLRAGGILSG